MSATYAFLAGEALRHAGVSEADAAIIAGFDVVDAVVERAVSRFPGQPLVDWEVAEARRWIVAETLKYVGLHDRQMEVYSAVYREWRNAFSPPKKHLNGERWAA